MKHVGMIAGRELRSFFVSPVAYVVLTLWAVLAGTFFLGGLFGFQESLQRAQQLQAFDFLQQANLNDHLLVDFFGSMWIVLMFLVPAITMGLFASEKANGTDELLLTSPITIWEVVLGKFLASAGFMALMTLVVAFFPAILFVYGDPEFGKTAAAIVGLYLVSLAYVAVGGFASSLTRNQLIAFVLGFVMLLVLGMMLPYIVEIGVARDSGGQSALAEAMRYVATGTHYEQMLKGLVDTKDLAYFAIVIGIFLLLTKTAVESVRWR